MRANELRATARQGGFTLIELVVVITILGILAAFAVPRFVAIDQQARVASRDALAGSVRSGSALAHAMWLATGQPANVNMEGQVVNIVNGYPDRATITNTLSDPNVTSYGFTYTAATGVFARPTGAACTVTYTGAAAGAAPNIATGGTC
jgi:MSHA pilin protein MshA